MELPVDLQEALQVELNQVLDLGALIYSRGHEAGASSVPQGYSQEQVDEMVAAAREEVHQAYEVWYASYDLQQDRDFWVLRGKPQPAPLPVEEPVSEEPPVDEGQPQ